MAMTYESMKSFMEEYFPVYSDYGQDPDTCQRMNEFYAPDFVFSGYMGFEQPVVFPSRDAFLAFDVSHPSSYERLTPEEMTIDDKNGTVFAIIRFEYIERASGEVLHEELGASRYQLVLDDKGGIKVKSLVFFPQRLVPGTPSGVDIFRRDAR